MTEVNNIQLYYNHPSEQELSAESLCYWVRETHLDGCRIDEESILPRGEDGRASAHPPVVWQIRLGEDPSNSKRSRRSVHASGRC